MTRYLLTAALLCSAVPAMAQPAATASRAIGAGLPAPGQHV